MSGIEYMLTEHRFAEGATAADIAARIAAVLDRAIAERGVASIAVSGGRSPRPVLEALSNAPLDWSKVIVTLVDERWVAPTHERSNARLVAENLLHGRAALARFSPLYAPVPDPERGLQQIGRLVDDLPLPFDAVVLGLGLDGHIASWFADGNRLADALDPRGTAPVLPMRAPAAGEPRMTLTLPALAAARHLYLHIEGAEKRALFQRIVRGASDSPLRALLDNTDTPLLVYWSP